MRHRAANKSSPKVRELHDHYGENGLRQTIKVIYSHFDQSQLSKSSFNLMDAEKSNSGPSFGLHTYRFLERSVIKQNATGGELVFLSKIYLFIGISL